jgi:hypothetical protein
MADLFKFRSKTEVKATLDSDIQFHSWTSGQERIVDKEINSATSFLVPAPLLSHVLLWEKYASLFNLSIYTTTIRV